MLLASFAVASAVAVSSQGTTALPMAAVSTPVVAQMDLSVTGIAQMVPSSFAGCSAVLAVFGPAVFRRARTTRRERRVHLAPLPQNYMYFPTAAR